MKSLHEQIANKCIHFNGIMEKTCKAGICYADVRDEPDEGPYKFPCLKQGGECKMAEFMTEEQVNNRVEEIESSGVNAMIAMASIKAHYDKTKEESGRIPCKCGGQLSYARSSFNGHFIGGCNSCGISFRE